MWQHLIGNQASSRVYESVEKPRDTHKRRRRKDINKARMRQSSELARGNCLVTCSCEETATERETQNSMRCTGLAQSTENTAPRSEDVTDTTEDTEPPELEYLKGSLECRILRITSTTVSR